MTYLNQVVGVMNLLQSAVGIIALILLSIPQNCAYYGGLTSRLFEYGIIMAATVLALFTMINSMAAGLLHQRCLAAWNICTGIAVLAVGVLLMAGLGVHMCTFTFLTGLLAIAMAVFFFVEGGFRFRRNSRAGLFLRQNISLAVQRGNAASVMATVEEGQKLEFGGRW
ncbi:hypothetical protein ACOME3_002926 [Neoechinorhynchus agilis]